ncbi:LuxR C-terminal-related transcriptional regulator [Streptomyces sp. Li-HN-5-11]|uniref:LuxR C-terminal-related transcriptional regulator n=1 Tax=Streptomyces sp. Li-HN-5-11 TaxID=3075432 RepID=UPI0028AC5071|nr:LuxR C-terminal-related transcriptional regulator [Streptomyces sp. Li-HN-5-11]WNM36785.1 LuxR C-terminal-related transcriptional regulator [Streptomyces sp. Li-HN-5-11]
MVVTARSSALPGAVSPLDPLGDPFLPTRFALPARPSTFLRRERLVKHLDQALGTPLTVVNGAAGAGKTLLVADWAAALGRPVAWLTLDAAFEGQGTFWAHLLQSLRTSGVPVTGEIGFPAADHVGHTLLTRLAAQLGGGDQTVTVVLDEYDRLASSAVSEQLAFVLHHARPRLRLVLISRTEPLLPLHRYRAAGEITEIRDAELAFTADEAVALLDLHGLHLSAEAASALVDRTRGWAAGLRLCALAAQHSPDPEVYLKEFEAGHSTVADFLLAEVLKRQPPRTQDLLLRVSVLERFCADLADALTERTDAGSLLAGLHRANAFVEDLGRGWYRLHPLFREILRTHLRERSPGLEPELHRRAARWLRRFGSLAEMLAHGAAAEDWEFTARALIDDLAIGQLFTSLCSDDQADPFTACTAAGTTSPATHLVHAARDLSRRDLDRGTAHLHEAEEQFTAGRSGSPAAHLSCALLEAVAARQAGSPDRAEQAASTARAVQHEIPAHLLEQHPELPALLLVHVGAARLWAGRFDEARAALTEVAGDPHGPLTAVPREQALGHLALMDYLDGWPNRAERNARAAVAETEQFSLPQPPGSGLGQLVLAAVAVDRNDLGRAQALLEEVPDPATPDPVTAAGRSIATARLLLARGRARAALAAVEPGVEADVTSPWAEREAALIVSAARLAEGRPDAAAEALRQVPDEQATCAVGAARAQLAAGDRPGALHVLDGIAGGTRAGPAVRVRAKLVRAQAAHTEGDVVAARRLLGEALGEARRERLRRPFLEAGPWIRPYLSSSSLRHLADDWLTPAREARAGLQQTPDESTAVLVERLSGREHDVLQRLAQMMSTEEIAADLYVSVNTVKTHLKSVYRKLAVNRRHDAVRRARALRLL